VALTIASGKSAFLAQQLAKPRPEIAIGDLAKLGDQLLETLAASAPETVAGGASGAAEAIETAAVPSLAIAEREGEHSARPPGRPAPAADEQHRADAAHRRFLRAVQSAAQSPPPSGLEPDPAQILGSQCPAAMEHLERLDDTVFEAIAGKPGALDELRTLWPEVLAHLGPELIEESREQYLRHALRVWRECLEGDQIRNPSLAVAAMDVVCLLFDE
jgi:hypothetical protein